MKPAHAERFGIATTAHEDADTAGRGEPGTPVMLDAARPAEPASLRVFVSYDRRNLDAVKTLAAEVEALGHRVWFDQDLTGGHRWWDSILAHIRECDLFVFAMTSESVESAACKKELDYAVQLQREVVPVLLSGEVRESLLPRRLAEIQYVDYRRHDRQTAFALIRTLGRLPAPRPLPDPLPEPPPAPGSYLGDLKERIDITGELSLDEQVAIVFKLKEHVRAGRAPDEARGLLRRLAERDDLRAKVAKEIDSALADGGRGGATRLVGHLPAPVPGAPERTSLDAATSGRPATTASAAERDIVGEPTLAPPGGKRYAIGKNPTLAVVLSVLVPGLGQFYNGDVKKGLVKLAVAVVAGSATYGLAWFGAAIWSGIDAYNVATGKSALW